MVIANIDKTTCRDALDFADALVSKQQTMTAKNYFCTQLRKTNHLTSNKLCIAQFYNLTCSR